MPAAPYDNLETVVNMARVRMNDAIQALGGEIMTDTASFTLQYVNNAWRRFQEFLSDKGIGALDRETQLLNVLAAGTSDTGARTSINWSNYFDGFTLWNSPVLPQDLIIPLALSERVSGSNTNFILMDREYGTLPSGPRGPLNKYWKWQQETIYLPGATGAVVILLNYAGFLADFVASSVTPWNSQPVPLMRSADAFAWYLCGEAARPRGDLDAAQFEQFGQQAASVLWNRDYRQERFLYKASELGKMPDVNSATLGPTGNRGPQRGGGGTQ